MEVVSSSVQGQDGGKMGGMRMGTVVDLVQEKTKTEKRKFCNLFFEWGAIEMFNVVKNGMLENACQGSNDEC